MPVGSLLLSVLICVASQSDAALEGELDLSDPRHVRALYLDLVGRTPNDDEMAMASGTRPDILVRHLCASEEFWNQWFEEELFYFLLVNNARPEDAPKGESLPERLGEGTITVPDAVRSIASSQAFNRANPGNDTFVSVVLEQLLGMKVQRNKAILEAGKKMYDGQRASLFGEKGDSQSDVVRIVTQQDDFFLRMVERQYQRIVGRSPSRDDVERWAEELQADGRHFSSLVQEWVLLPVYAERLSTYRTKSDRQFLGGLFVDLTGDLPDALTMRRLRTALASLADAAPLRAVIARVLLDKDIVSLPARDEVDPQNFIEESFARFFGRPPTANEAGDFLLVWQQMEVGPETIIAALVTHWEYQNY